VTRQVPSNHRSAVTTAVAPLWADAEAGARLAPVLRGSLGAFRTWLADLVGRQTSLIGALDTVALRGEPVQVLEQSSTSLLRVLLPDQPNGETGYIGFMDPAHIGVDARARVTHLLRVDAVDGAGLAAGSGVELMSDRGDRVEVLSADGNVTRCRRDALRAVASPRLGAESVLDIARSFVGTPYVWGGLDKAGIDCSGLIHVAARIAGYVLPRDARYQWEATRADVRWGALCPGDLLFFGDGPSLEGVHHVGFYAGDNHLLHAPEEGRRVALEPISKQARDRAVGIGRLPPM
jgi:hypothetical protein